MTTPHDFKAALRAYNDNRYDTPQEWVTCAAVIDNNELDEAIRFALQLAEKVCGEPSEAAIKAGWEQYREDFHCHGRFNDTRHFQAMRDQMIKEIEQGDG